MPFGEAPWWLEPLFFSRFLARADVGKQKLREREREKGERKGIWYLTLGIGGSLFRLNATSDWAVLYFPWSLRALTSCLVASV
ncbi:uncharacterized protein BDW43DRAFT_88991 [Aspergillus alliaceus]|uniref:uncharacterized protein n=1 Tax=Petromyces alliaceus TaxID=209559 RepID=UPI0012A65D8A|nr:uncharacterized protein BDW43DRAFT_88991 [Aspergillus alliaceus]KAB8233531.1 hypothetical protein BDW43DRAFT_88991 [Aspergillus alliaceus]